MSGSESKMVRFGQAWADALEKTEPAFDQARSRERFLRACDSRASTRHAPIWPWACAAAAALLLVLGGMALWQRSMPRPVASAVVPGAWIETQAGESFPLEFSEGSRILVHGPSRVQVASVDPRGARLTLLRGAISAKIAHRPDTDWSFAAGPFSVKVTGTRLRVAWDPATEQFEVRVDEGSVLVSGPLVENGRSIAAGQRFSVRVRESELELKNLAMESPRVAPPVFSIADLPAGPASASGVRSPARPASDRSWQELEQRGSYREAVAAAERMGVGRIYETGSVEDLMTLARAARHAGRDDVATECLLRCRRRFPSDPRAATAAFLLGRSASPAGAAEWFATYLREQPGGPLAREAAGRLLESYQRAGNQAAAKDAARKYLASYPDGLHAPLARRVLGEATGP